MTSQATDVVFVAVRLARAFLAISFCLIIAAAWRLLPICLGARFPRAAFACLLSGFGIRVTRTGNWKFSHGLLLPNHVSWTDVLVLGVVANASFVAKREVQNWPVIGPLAVRYGSLFISRKRGKCVRAQDAELATRVKQNSLILFPEGTTGNGLDLLQFRSSLLASANASGVQCFPVSIDYRWRNGQRLGAAGWKILAWVGEDSLMQHAFRLALAPSIAVNVHIGAPIYRECRKRLAIELQNSIKTKLGDSYGP